MDYELKNGTVAIEDDKVGEMLESYMDLCEFLHEHHDKITPDMALRLDNMIYKHYEP